MELDGLRGVAILLVVSAHAWNGELPAGRRLWSGTSNFAGGGWLGVQLFFVLSGFLITSVLLGERSDTGTIALRSFYARRFRRLLPALYLVCVCFGVFALAFRRGPELRAALGGIVRSVLYIENVDRIADRLPTDGYLGHTWSLAVEEQFYLAWPVALLVLSRFRPTVAKIFAAAVIALTIVARLWLDARGEQVYELMHWDALMLGCLLALAPVKIPLWAGWVAVGLVAVLSVETPESLGVHTFLITAVIGFVLVATATSMPWLRADWLRYFGRISYGLYLWHALLLRFGWHAVPSVLLSILLADLSFRIVEQRFMNSRGRLAKRVPIVAIEAP